MWLKNPLPPGARAPAPPSANEEPKAAEYSDLDKAAWQMRNAQKKPILKPTPHRKARKVPAPAPTPPATKP